MSTDEVLEVEENNGEGTSMTERKGRATPGKRNKMVSSEESKSFLSRMFGGIGEYFRGVRDEMTKVVWPDRSELIRLTYIVSLVTIASAMALGLLSFVYTYIFKVGINENQPWIFIIVFGLAGVASLFFQRQANNNNDISY